MQIKGNKAVSLSNSYQITSIIRWHLATIATNNNRNFK